MSITKNDLDHALTANNEVLRTDIRAEMRAEIRTAIADNNEVLRAELASKADLENSQKELREEIRLSEARTHAHIDHVMQLQRQEMQLQRQEMQQQTKVIVESFREQFGALDDRLQAHIDDESVHVKRRRR